MFLLFSLYLKTYEDRMMLPESYSGDPLVLDFIISSDEIVRSSLRIRVTSAPKVPLAKLSCAPIRLTV